MIPPVFRLVSIDLMMIPRILLMVYFEALSSNKAKIKACCGQESRKPSVGVKVNVFPWITWAFGRNSKEMEAGGRVFDPAKINFRKRRKFSKFRGRWFRLVLVRSGCSCLRPIVRYQFLLILEPCWFSEIDLFLWKWIERNPPSKGHVKSPSYGRGVSILIDINVSAFLLFPPRLENNYQLVLCIMALTIEDKGTQNVGERDFPCPYPKSHKGDETPRRIQAEGTWFPDDVHAQTTTDPGDCPIVVALYSGVLEKHVSACITLIPHDANMGLPVLKVFCGLLSPS